MTALGAMRQYEYMDDADIELRNLTYRMFVDAGKAPTVDEVAEAAGETPLEIARVWRRLSDAHALVLQADSMQLRMLNPFSAVVTSYQVHTGGRSWYGNCAWDAFGICAALHADGHIEWVCPDCGEPTEAQVHAGIATPDDLVFHCLVPAAQWWDDIVYT